MSSAPKRPHEEVGHSSSSKYGHEDTVAGYPKLSSSGAPTDFHHPTYEMGQDARVVKIPRNESRDSDRRSPLHSIYRMPSTSSHDAHIDTHQPAAESRLESRDSKDIPRIEARELYGEVKRDENKEVKNDRESYSDLRSDTKTEKDGFGVSGGHLNWKDSKEYLRGKRYSDAPSGTMDPWHMPRGNVHGLVEVGKDSSATEERDHVEAHEAIGENRVDLKAEERFKEKDRKRKDIKHRDWGDRDKERGERRSILQGDYKELAKEEKESEKGERDRKDISKDKEKLRDREKDHMKRESWSGVEKEGLHNEKEIGDGSGRVSQPDLENSASEQKKQKEFDGWKNVDRDVRDRRRERDADLEGDRPEKRPRSYDKESDDGGTDLEGAAERERDAFGYGVQQRKRMLRPRGSPQVGNRELRLRPRTQENEGSPGKSEVSSVIYEVGECMQELVKLWKKYEASQAEKDGDSSNCGPTLEVRIPAEHVTATNRQVRGGQLWGTDIYTDDSDLVAVLMHTGYCRPTASPPPPAIQELRATIRVLPPQDCYKSEQRNNVRSRAWGAGSGCSYRIERCCIVKKGGGTIDLEPCLTHSATVEPTLAPVAVERTMTTRAAASNALRQQRFVREVTIQYNLCNEPWVKYSISIVADKGLKKPLYTSARLKKGEVLYLETHSCRYELCFNGEKMVKAQLHDAETDKPQNHHTHASNGEKNDGENIMIDGFRWSRCKKPLPQKVMRSIGIPLPLEHVEVLEENIDWEDVQWSQTGVWITGKEYNLARVHFLSMN